MIREILRFARPLGHNEKPENSNLGFGFLYYGLVRAVRPGHVLVIGSGFGFSVVCLALGLKDNGKGLLTFVDPSYDILRHGPFRTVGGRGKWSDPDGVAAHFDRFGVGGCVTHHRMTSEEFFQRYRDLGLPPIDVAFVDGNHAYENVKHDFLEILKHARKNTYIFLHDTHIYIREMVRHSGVKRWLGVLKRNRELFEGLDFPFSSGVSIVRVLRDDTWRYLVP
ncbi:MAG: class I SAM-dependent methyltransferase [Deltaproteobacteria bacterium]|nr:class I SAM-dependent methyltransferase [Deltaproteobacteria bacterium]